MDLDRGWIGLRRSVELQHRPAASPSFSGDVGERVFALGDGSQPRLDRVETRRRDSPDVMGEVVRTCVFR